MDELLWSDWIPFSQALAIAPRVPGVYMAREGATGDIVYIGMAGERSGGGKPQGIRGRLAIYASGKGLASGLGEAVFDRALADLDWLQARINELITNGPRRAKYWGIEAFNRADLHIRWTTTADRVSAATLERELLLDAGESLWNRANSRRVTAPRVADASQTWFVRAPDSGGSAGPQTQRVTAADLAAGQVRIPIAFKGGFPTERQQIVVVLRGETVTCGWNPKVGPDKQRSGLLRPPRDVLQRLVMIADHLMIGTDGLHITLS